MLLPPESSPRSLNTYAELPRTLWTRGLLTMDKMQVQAAIAALYGSDAAESARANTFLMEFTEQPVRICVVVIFQFRLLFSLTEIE